MARRRRRRSGAARCDRADGNISTKTKRMCKPAISPWSSAAGLQLLGVTLGSEPASATHNARNPHPGVCTRSPSHRSKTIQTILLELARCSQRYPCLASTSSVAHPAWGEEGSKKPPNLRQAYLRRALCSSRGQIKGASCARVLLLESALRGCFCLKARCVSCCIAATPDLTSAQIGCVL